MIRKKTWILLASFGVVLAAYLVWDAVESDGSPVEVTPSPEPLWSVASEDIVGVVVEDLEALETLELLRDEEQLWKISEPDLGPADVARVERAVSWLASPSPRSVILCLQSQNDLAWSRTRSVLPNPLRLKPCSLRAWSY